MAETLGVMLLCATGTICVALPCIAWLAFMVWLLTEAA